MQYYLCFKVNKIPDLTMVKYSVYDISGQEDLIDKHSVFLRQLHRLGVESNVFFHLLYFYDGQEGISKGKRLQIIFYATAESPRKLELIREFVTTSVLSTYYDFYCYEISSNLNYVLQDGYLKFTNISGNRRNYKLSSSIKPSDYEKIKKQIEEDQYLYCAVQPETNEVTEINSQSFFLDGIGRIGCGYEFDCGAFLTKKDYHLYAQNRLYNDPQNALIPIYSIMEWLPNDLGRLYNVLKLMEGYNETAALRIDIFPSDIAEAFTDNMAPTINELRQRMAQHDQGKDDNCDTVLKSIESITKKLMKYPQFYANIVALADHRDIAVMLVDSVGAEAVESGSYLVKDLSCFDPGSRSYDIYSYDSGLIVDQKSYGSDGNYMSDYVSLYTLDEIRPMFSFPVLYPGETIECMKETDPEFDESGKSTMFLGMSNNGYAVNFPVKLFKKHAFIAGVPGAGKTNTMLYMVSTLWNEFHVPFLVLEPAKQEYRALAKASMLAGMEALKDICIFSPGADTKFPLHINPFEFPKGLTLAEHIANLNAVFAGAFELPPPSPHFIDTCIEQVYINKGWNINSRNTGELPYPTMQELYDSLNIAVQSSHYQGETLGNLRSVMEVRVGSLLKREIGNVYNVEQSSFKPEEWLDRPVIIELESLGEGPANFMALLISTLIRETLKIRKTQDKTAIQRNPKNKTGVNHIIFYEEAHNLIGPTQENVGEKVDPKVSATKFLVKMLAEVRALDEGIVIADQLPSVMAPEVLKNTGLKIGHRITANDDRELLGSTMSASADQLAEQSIYLPGEALVFYEGLLKPFKMKMTKWQLSSEEYCNLATDELLYFLDDYYGGDEDMVTDTQKIERYYDGIYDSPTDVELHAIIRNYPVYKELKTKSMEIIVQRVITSFTTLYERFRSINSENIIPSSIEAKKLMDILHRYRRQYYGAKNATAILADIKKVEGFFVSPKSKFTELSTVKGDKKISISDALKNVFTECDNLFFNNISVVMNYEEHALYMSFKIIEAYLHAFECVDFEYLWGNAALKAILERTDRACKLVCDYVNIEDGTETGAFAGTEYYSPLFERSHQITKMRIAYDFNLLHEELDSIIDWNSQYVSESNVIGLAEKYAEKYRYWMAMADCYGEHSKEIQAYIISRYTEIFDGFKVIRDIRNLAHYLVRATKDICGDVSKYVSWTKSGTPGSLFGLEQYDALVEKCVNFARIQMYDVYYQEAEKVSRDILKEVNNDYAMLKDVHIAAIARAYQAAYGKAFDLCADINSLELMAESVDLFYTMFTEIGVHLQGKARTYLSGACSSTCGFIDKLRAKYYSSTVRDVWKQADTYVNG